LLSSPEPPKLTQKGQPLLANRTSRLQSKRTELEVGPDEALVVLGVLPQAVVVGRGSRANALARERRGDTDVHGQASGVLPTREGHVSRPTSRSFLVTKDASLFQHRRQETFVSHLGHQVSDAIVTHNDVSVLFTARGVIAV
jgi:hypothetical protein